MKKHMQATHKTKVDDDTKILKSILKNPLLENDFEPEVSIDNDVIELNTLFNGCKTRRDHRIISTLRKLTKLQDSQSKKICNECDDKYKGDSELRNHNEEEHLILLSHHNEEGKHIPGENSDDDDTEFDPLIWDVLLAETDDGKELESEDAKKLTEEEVKEILKLHRYFAHRCGNKLWENLLQPAGRFKGKKRLILEFLEKCDVCRKFKKTPPRPKVGLPKAKDVNDIVSIDLKIMKKAGKREVAILYMHDEFSKLIKGQVVDNKTPDTIIKAIEAKWIIGGGAGPGHPTRGFFSDNGGEFLNEQFIDFASTLDITVKMTAASSPWMNGSCERAHATVDKIVEKIQEDDPKLGLQKAVDLACFVKNSEVNRTGFSPLQLLCGKSPSFPGLSDCSPSAIELEGNNEYLKILRRMDQARISARQVDCNHRLKMALKSRINPSCEKSYSFGERVHFKLDSSNQWKSGTVLGKDGKVLFIKYGNFMRRVTLDRVIPAGGYYDGPEDEVDKNDEDNQERLLDDDFKDVEILVKKDRQIEQLEKENSEQKKRITELENKSSSHVSPKTKTTQPTLFLPKLYHKIRFKLEGKQDFVVGKVMHKHKAISIHRNRVGIKLENGITTVFDFSTEVEEWEDINNTSEGEHDIFATVLTRAQVKDRPEADIAMADEVKKFERFDAFKTVLDEGQSAIKTRWVFTEADDESKGCKLKARLCMRGD